MTKAWECLTKEEEEVFLKAYDSLLEVVGIDDEIDKIKLWCRDPQGNAYELIIRWNNKKLCWEAKVI